MMWQRVWGFVSCLIVVSPVWGEDVRVAEEPVQVVSVILADVYQVSGINASEITGNYFFCCFYFLAFVL